MLSALTAAFASAAPVVAAEARTLAQQSDPFPWFVGAAVLTIATLTAADAKADRRRH